MHDSQPATTMDVEQQKLDSDEDNLQAVLGLNWPKGKCPATTKTTTTATPKASVSASDLPQPQNSNHISTAPFKDKFITNSSYLAAEIPLKLGHFVSNMWTSGSELSSSFFVQRADESKDRSLWLLGCQYEMPDNQIKMQNDMLDAQKDDMFGANKMDESTPENDESTKKPAFAMSLLWPPDFYEDFTSRIWMTYRHNYPPIRPSSYKTDIGWGCMLRSGQSLLANALVIHFLGREWRRSSSRNAAHKEYFKIVHWFLDELSPRAPFSIHRIALLGKQLGKNIGEWFGPSTISQVIQALVSDFPPAKMGVYIATDGVVYRKDVQDVATGKKPRGDFGRLSSRAHPTKDDREEARKIYNNYNATVHEPVESDGQFRSILVLVAIRLGIDSLHPSYYPGLKIAKRYTPVFTIEKQAPEYDEDVRSENDFGIVSEEEDHSCDNEDCL
ncbi:Cysteine protease atg4 [Apophysomyces ossiformis]|uniref:Cysteine protease n=1 Tax=Apophysomyces ossiformis TaxID=679940 RepID=A0A8H7ESR1_9FUNG|nr:Cysteine protease atg4 [Apophysomyces ossiformis]